jgi:CheY-like chemotaxis protein
MRVFTCLSGQEAVNMARERPFDLVFMDHMMPGMDGVETTKHIRALIGERFKKLPIIALTANAISGMREMFLENGFNDFLSKPIETSKLNTILEKWIPAEKRLAMPEDEKSRDASEVDLAAALPEIDGIDATAGVAIVGGSHERYHTLLDMFCLDVRPRLLLLGQPLTDEFDLKFFTTQVHALKSALANIGAQDLSTNAAALEDAGRKGDMLAIGANCGAFREAVESLAERIEAALAQIHSVRGQNLSERETVEQALVRLREVLEMEELDAIDAALQAAQALQLDSEIREDISRIAELILIADFNKAAELVSAVIKTNLKRKML